MALKSTIWGFVLFLGVWKNTFISWKAQRGNPESPRWIRCLCCGALSPWCNAQVNRRGTWGTHLRVKAELGAFASAVPWTICCHWYNAKEDTQGKVGSGNEATWKRCWVAWKPQNHLYCQLTPSVVAEKWNLSLNLKVSILFFYIQFNLGLTYNVITGIDTY